MVRLQALSSWRGWSSVLLEWGGGFFPLKYPSCGEAASRALLGLWKQVELEGSPRRSCRTLRGPWWFESHTCP